MFNYENEEFKNENYAASLRYYFDSNKRDVSTYQNISLCYYNIGINFYNNNIYPKALENLNECLKYANDFSIKSDAQYYIRQCKSYNLFNDAQENINNKNNVGAIGYCSQAKNLFNTKSMKNKCNKNIGHCYLKEQNEFNNSFREYLEYQKSKEEEDRKKDREIRKELLEQTRKTQLENSKLLTNVFENMQKFQQERLEQDKKDRERREKLEREARKKEEEFRVKMYEQQKKKEEYFEKMLSQIREDAVKKEKELEKKNKEMIEYYNGEEIVEFISKCPVEGCTNTKDINWRHCECSLKEYINDKGYIICTQCNKKYKFFNRKFNCGFHKNGKPPSKKTQTIIKAFESIGKRMSSKKEKPFIKKLLNSLIDQCEY